ncbi:hypothetical protein [Streptomyces sp. NRRL WC-3549]|uniref:hypothetical protein n=1 Tax=Streptomyces sp. NRRL WC-3549 TaxID=1463925 RepID=UPI000D71FE6F|nr:hypothetical protein [Streptomyces sp. NRRL WC-3549]
MKTSKSLGDMIAVSSPRISLMGSRDRTDTDTVQTQERHREPAPLERPARSGEFVRLRQQFCREATERRDRCSGDRRLRVLAYSLVTSRSATPDEDWNTLQAEAEQHGYAMGARFHDVAVPVTTTYRPGSGAGRGIYTPPWKRPGWGEVERLIRGGFADGVIVLDRHNISSDDDEYRAVIKELGERYQAFIHLVIPEEPPGPT